MSKVYRKISRMDKMPNERFKLILDGTNVPPNVKDIEYMRKIL
jgi:hypothetical protein